MDFSIASILMLDGVTNGAIYALLAPGDRARPSPITRVIFIPQGEFVAFGALTLAMLQMGKTPGTVWLLVANGGDLGGGRSRRCLQVGASRHADRPCIALAAAQDDGGA